MTYSKAIKNGWKPIYPRYFHGYISWIIKAGNKHLKKWKDGKYYIDAPCGQKIYFLPPWVAFDKYNFEEDKQNV